MGSTQSQTKDSRNGVVVDREVAITEETEAKAVASGVVLSGRVLLKITEHPIVCPKKRSKRLNSTMLS